MIHTINIGWGGARQIIYLMDLDEALDKDLYLLDFIRKGLVYEPEIVHLLCRALRNGDTVIDVGANVGFFTLLMSDLVGTKGQVLSCEPGSNNLPALRQNLAINGTLNVYVVEQPLWRAAEEVTFYLNADHRTSNSLYDPGLYYANAASRAKPQPMQMKATTLDALCESFGKTPRFVKVDTEGADMRVLEGLGKHRPDFIVVELNPDGMRKAGHDTEDFRSLMRGRGYELFVLRQDGSMPALVPRNSRMSYYMNQIVLNVLFSTLDSVGEAWPEVGL